MSESPSRVVGAIASFFGDGPWRSKSVLAALTAVVVGLGFWISDIKDGRPPPAASSATAPGMEAPPATNPSPPGEPWNWSKPVPGYVRIGASYAAAYCIGWLFRRLMRLILVASALALALLAYGKFIGWDLTPAREQVKRGREWAQHETAAQRDYLIHLLPSAAGGGAGLFMGFRRRRRLTPGSEGRRG